MVASVTHLVRTVPFSQSKCHWVQNIISLFFFFFFPFTGAQSFSYARYGSGTGPSLLDRLGCTGSEKALLNCSHTEIGGFTSYYCYNDDVGVRCQGKYSV